MGKTFKTVPNILLIDDDTIIAMIVEEMLKNKFKVDKCTNGVDALHHIALCDYPLIITDINMPFLNGIDLINFINQSKIDSKFILLSSSIEQYRETILQNVIAKFGKPFDALEFVKTVHNFFSQELYGNSNTSG